MGAWGVGIFQNDDAMDVKEMYNSAIIMMEDEKAEEYVLSEYGDEATNDIWIALAVCEWKKGRLSQKVKEKATKCIKEEEKEISQIWETKNAKKRQKVLTETLEMLNSKMPERKKARMPSYAMESNFEVGDVFQYKQRIYRDEKYKDNEYYVICQVVIIEKQPSHLPPLDTVYAVVLDWFSQYMPSKENLENVTISSLATLSNRYVNRNVFHTLIDKDSIKQKDIKLLSKKSFVNIVDEFKKSSFSEYEIENFVLEKLYGTYPRELLSVEDLLGE